MLRKMVSLAVKTLPLLRDGFMLVGISPIATFGKFPKPFKNIFEKCCQNRVFKRNKYRENFFH